MDSMDSIADRLNALFDSHRRDDGQPFTNVEIEQKTKHQLEASYIGKLRNGRVDNPTVNTLKVLAKAFGITPDYFLRPDPMAQSGENQVRIALRSSGLNRDTQRYLEQLIDSLQKENKTGIGETKE